MICCGALPNTPAPTTVITTTTQLCFKDTLQTCGVRDCYDYSDATCDSNSHCMCGENMCSSGDGVCVPLGAPAGNPACSIHLGSSCLIWGCGDNSWCGPGHKCVCKYGFCVANGACAAPPSDEPATCNVDTGGKCSLFACHSDRGPTRCYNGHCLCDFGSCTSDGMCVTATDGGFSSRLELSAVGGNIGEVSNAALVPLLGSASLLIVAFVVALRAFWRSPPLNDAEDPKLRKSLLEA